MWSLLQLHTLGQNSPTLKLVSIPLSSAAPPDWQSCVATIFQRNWSSYFAHFSEEQVTETQNAILLILISTAKSLPQPAATPVLFYAIALLHSNMPPSMENTEGDWGTQGSTLAYIQPLTASRYPQFVSPSTESIWSAHFQSQKHSLNCGVTL